MCIRDSTGSVNTNGDPAVVYLYYNAQFTNALRWTSQTVFNASLFAKQDSTGLFVLPAQSTPPIAAFHVSNGDTIDVDLANIGIDIPPGGYITAVISSSSNMTQASASFIYVED